SIVRSLIDRFRTLFVTHAALELEAELIADFAERKADLLRRAEQYEKEGLTTVATELRRCAEALTPDRPLSSVLAAVAHLREFEVVATCAKADIPADANASADQAVASEQARVSDQREPAHKKKTRKS